MNTCKTSYVRSERGLALLISMVLLIAATLLALFTHRNLSFGIKSQSNQLKSIMAQEAAMAGLDSALSVLVNADARNNLLSGSPSVNGWYNGHLYGFFRDDSSGPLSLQILTNTSAPTIPTNLLNSFQVRFKCLDAPAPPQPENPNPCINKKAIQIAVLGCAKGQTPNANENVCISRAVATQTAILKPAMASTPAAALTAKGDVDLSGNVEITNQDYETNGTTIHAGGSYTTDGSADLVTLPGTPPDASVAVNDGTLASLSDERFFQGFFGQTKDSVKYESTQITCSGTGCTVPIKNAENKGKVIWVNTAGATINASGGTSTIGTATNPVILIIDGPLQITGNITIYGVVYCSALTWDNTGGGTSKVIGAAIAEGDFEATGTPNPTYSKSVLDNVKRNLSRYTRITGSWKDWCDDCSFTAW